MKKTLSFAGLHFMVAFTVGYLLTGDIILGSLIAMIEPMVNTVAFYFHEKAWLSPRFIRAQFTAPRYKTFSFAVVHFSVAFIVAYLLTGDLLIGGIMATIEPAINTLVYYFHEGFWQRRTAQAMAKQQVAVTLSCHHRQLGDTTPKDRETANQLSNI